MNTFFINKQNYIYEYIKSEYEISQLTPLLEIKRYFIIQDLFDIIENKLKQNNIYIKINSVLPKWLMKTISLGDYKIDPIIPYNPNDFTSLIIDIKNVSKTNKSIEEIKDIIVNKINLNKLCNSLIEKIRDFIKSDFYINNRNKFIIKYEEIPNFKLFRIITSIKNNEIDYNNINLKINNNLFNKLIKSYKFNINENKSRFINLVFILVLRYYTLESYNQQLACLPTFYEELKNKYNVNFELFGSTFNSFYNNYCCLFPDVEKYFGGICNFNDILVKKGFYVANPPFDNSIMENMANNLITFLHKSSYSLNFIITIPVWDKDEHIYGEYKTLSILKKSEYFKHIYKIDKKKARFLDYINNRIITPVSMYIILLQNPIGTKEYNITEHEFIKVINDFWIKAPYIIQKGGNINYLNSIKDIDSQLDIINSKYKKFNINLKLLKNPKKINYNNYTISSEVYKNKFYWQALELHYPYNLLYTEINYENCIPYSELNKKNVKMKKIKNVNIPIHKDKKILVSKNCNINNSFPSFELLYILIKYNFNFNKFNNIGIIDITPTYNDLEYEKFIIKRNDNYIYAINQYFITQTNKLELNYKLHNIINKNIKKELKKCCIYNFIVISGSLEYFTLKKLYNINEEILHYIFFYQKNLILKLLKHGGNFIMRYKNTNTELSHKILYFISMFFKKISIIKIKNNMTVQHIIGIDFIGIDKKILDNLLKLILKLKKVYPKFGEEINIKDEKLRKKLDITLPWKNKYTDVFIHELFSFNLPKEIKTKFDLYNKKLYNKSIKEEKIIKYIIKLYEDNNQDELDYILANKIKYLINFCKRNNIPVNPLYSIDK